MAAHKDRLIAAAELLGMTPDALLTALEYPAWHGAPDTFGPDDEPHPRAGQSAPEGFAVFAHWSAAHDGINVEVDAPEGLPLTIHVNDWRMLNVIVGTDEPADSADEPWPAYGPVVLDDDGSHSVGCVCDQCVDEDVRCDVWLGRADDEGGEHRCAGPAGHAGSHDARPARWTR